MKLFERTRCPYCNKKVNLFTTWALRREGEFHCPRCQGISNIVLDMRLSYISVGAAATSAVFFLIIRFLFSVEKLSALFFILIPIFIFYILSLFMVRLKKPVKKKKKRSQNMRDNTISKKWNDSYDLEQTKVL